MSFGRQLKKGLLGEGEISQFLIGQGYSVLPAYEVEIGSGKGPRLFTADGPLVAPDMLVFDAVKVFWVEAKTKSGWSYFRLTGTAQDGIDTKHWKSYVEVQRKLPWDVWVLFLHREAKWDRFAETDATPPPPGLYGSSVPNLETTIHHESPRHASGMVYWNGGVPLRLLARYEDGKIVAMRRGSTEPLTSAWAKEVQAAGLVRPERGKAKHPGQMNLFSSGG